MCSNSHRSFDSSRNIFEVLADLSVSEASSSTAMPNNKKQKKQQQNITAQLQYKISSTRTTQAPGAVQRSSNPVEGSCSAAPAVDTGNTHAQPMAGQEHANGEALTAAAEEEGTAKKVRNPIVWIDLEMTGLDLQADTIVEVACLITDSNLNIIAEGPDLAIHHEDLVLEAMNEWSQVQHAKSGLTEKCRESTISLQEAEALVLAFLQQHTEPGTTQLAGNSVHVDLAFLRRCMPGVAAHLHYRIIDVSTVMELCRRWYNPEYHRAPRKVQAHTAMSDIRDSITQLRYYRRAIFKPPHPR